MSRQEGDPELPHTFTVSMSPEHAELRARAAKRIKGVTFEEISTEVDSNGKLRVIGQTVVSDWKALHQLNSKVNIHDLK